MNEAEAKTKWCAESRVESPDMNDGSRNRNWKGEPVEGSLCLGHRCMMFVPDREAFDNAMYAFEESRMNGDGTNVISLIKGGDKTPPAPEEARPKEPDIKDFYKCGKVFPDIV